MNERELDELKENISEIIRAIGYLREIVESQSRRLDNLEAIVLRRPSRSSLTDTD